MAATLKMDTEARLQDCTRRCWFHLVNHSAGKCRAPATINALPVANPRASGIDARGANATAEMAPRCGSPVGESVRTPVPISKPKIAAPNSGLRC
jgi:hypothetical protein